MVFRTQVRRCKHASSTDQCLNALTINTVYMTTQKDIKKDWQKPELVVYGDVAEITKQIKAKTLGSGDDFGIAGIQDPSGVV